MIGRAGDVPRPLGLELTVEMRRVVGPGGLGIAIVSALVRLAIEARRRIVGALLDRLLRGGQRLRAVRQQLVLVLLHSAVFFALVSSADWPRPRRRGRFPSQDLLHFEVRLELIRLDLLLLALTPQLLLAHLALQLLTIRLLRRAVGRWALASEVYAHRGWHDDSRSS